VNEQSDKQEDDSEDDHDVFLVSVQMYCRCIGSGSVFEGVF
jgi:hypothetical protein